MSENWHNWCRFCAKISSKDINSVNKIESISEQLEIVNKYFMMSLILFEGVQCTICSDCQDFLTKVEGFRDTCLKTDQMFRELICQKDVSDLYLETIRFKFGIDNEEVKYNILTEETTNLDIPEQTIDPLETQFVNIKQEITLEDYKVQPAVVPRKRGRPRKLSSRVQQSRLKLKTELKDSSDGIEISSEKLIEEDLDYAQDPSNDTVSDDDLPLKKRHKAPKAAKKETVCEFCCKTFKAPCLLKEHIWSKHRKEDRPFVCSECSKRFSSKGFLKKHMDIHLPDSERRIHPCPYCDKKFTQKNSVQSHINCMHFKEKPFICEECGKSCGQKSALKQHMETHTEERPFKCFMCPKMFKSAQQAKMHEIWHKDITYPCPHCDLKLKSKITLRSHMLVHSDVRKYKCNYCGNEFKRSKTLKNHLILHTGQRPYECPFCDKTFAHGSNCRSHQKKSHPEELAALEASGERPKNTKIPRLDQLQPKQPVVTSSISLD
ncbi:zinc finger protein 184-like [Phlebotomus papatasi]|uniref:zinc finger protein 184-like n=1 Tax=Phlebotomus papatasi TaxID=29031 RepID=UPI0024842AE2|nr:zinc finger protein 184-like [Phlebotomus papatasi]